MRGSDANWPAAAAPDEAASRTGSSRMLLDELLARREGPSVPEPAPALTIEPVAVPTTGEVGRRAARQRLAELEDAARRNLRSAEEARRVLQAEHERLQEESSARRAAQEEANALRRELERLRSAEEKRAAREKSLAARAARQEIADEIKKFHEEHDRVVHELNQLRGALDDHDGLLDEYTQRLREEQQMRNTMREELDKAETERRLAERALERATEAARRHAEDELIRLATAESALADARSDVERLSAQLAELTAGEGVVGQLQQQVDAQAEEIERLHGTIAALATRAEAAEAAVADAEAEVVRARADGDNLRAHAAALGDELAAVRAEVAELQTAASARGSEVPAAEPERAIEPVTDSDTDDRVPEPPAVDAPPPLARRRPRAERTHDVRAPYEPLPVRRAARVVEVSAAAIASPAGPESGPDPELVPAPESELVAAGAADGYRRTAMAELTAIASSNDDFTFRKR